ncbi:hypothetical protein BV25DRAFT_1819965, partial [Artomyces pyxidatus]
VSVMSLPTYEPRSDARSRSTSPIAPQHALQTRTAPSATTPPALAPPTHAAAGAHLTGRALRRTLCTAVTAPAPPGPARIIRAHKRCGGPPVDRREPLALGSFEDRIALSHNPRSFQCTLAPPPTRRADASPAPRAYEAAGTHAVP